MNGNTKKSLIATLMLTLVSPCAFSCDDEGATEAAIDVNALVELFDQDSAVDCG
jgi:hypothetical protein